MFDGDTVDRTIRNHEYRGWPMFVLCIAFPIIWIGILNLGPLGVSAQVGITLLVLTGISFFAMLVAGTVLGLHRSIRKIKLGSELEVQPGNRRYTIAQLYRIDLRTDPREDYRESGTPVRYCSVRIEGQISSSTSVAREHWRRGPTSTMGKRLQNRSR